MRVHNFNAGPGTLPESVLRQAQQDIWDIAGSGMGIMEHSHRGKVFQKIIDEAEAEARGLAGIPDAYDVLFVQGGASQQFAMVPMNLLAEGRTADYLVTGSWSQKALKEAKLFGATHVAATGEPSGFAELPSPATIRYSPDPVYVHVTTNNTIFGTEWPDEPPVPEGVPLVADASSDIFSRPIDIGRYGLIYAGAQKNLGPSGIVLVIIRKDLVERGPAKLATMLQYRTYAKNQSLYNTPPTLAIYMVGLVLKWIRETGGLSAMGERNAEKAGRLYAFLDQSEFYRPTASATSRSLMNVCFRAPSEELEARLVKAAEQKGLAGLKGHRSVGGMRASLYNACSLESVEALIAFLQDFERENR